jgi:hypothetical protein
MLLLLRSTIMVVVVIVLVVGTAACPLVQELKAPLHFLTHTQHGSLQPIVLMKECRTRNKEQ